MFAQLLRMMDQYWSPIGESDRFRFPGTDVFEDDSGRRIEEE